MIKTRFGILAITTVGSLSLGGCAHVVGFEPLASQTLRAGAEQDADVVWLLRLEGDSSQARETVLRCYNSAQGPVCVPARLTQ